VFLPERNEIESAWLAAPPAAADAFAAHSEAIARWQDAVAARSETSDTRPWWARRYWSKRESAAR
jgi:hypothetical protein